MKKRNMVVWECLLGDLDDAKPEDMKYGGVMICNLPIRGRCFIESHGKSGAGPRFLAKVHAAGLEMGLKRPTMKGCIRASTKVRGEKLFRGLIGDE